MNIVVPMAAGTTQAYLGFYLSVAFLLFRPTSGIAIGGGMSRDLRDPNTGKLGGGDSVISGQKGSEDPLDLDPRLAAFKNRLTLQGLDNYAKALLQLDNYKQLPAKRLSVSGFYGARGKKFGQSNAFYGSRGRRSAGGDHLYLAGGKRIDPDTFFGMRGKRTYDLEPQIKHSIERYLGELLAANDVYGDDVADVMRSDDVTENEEATDSALEDGADKEMLLKLVDYFLSHRYQRVQDTSDFSYNKVKRQPPSGFHAIRGR